MLFGVEARYLEDILVIDHQLNDDAYFPLHDWLSTDKGHVRSNRVKLKAKKSTVYHVFVDTADQLHAGTDASVYAPVSTLLALASPVRSYPRFSPHLPTIQSTSAAGTST